LPQPDLRWTPVGAFGSLSDPDALTTSGQTADVYLAGLAFRKSGLLATLDRSVQWRAVRGANAGLVERIGG
jgi:flagellar biosynthesis/type III secretory pathway chaperone